jgi:hypothetical protein
MYKKAIRAKLRFQTSKGLLTIEQLWGLTLTELKNLIISLHETVKKVPSEDLSFLETETVQEESEDKMRFNIAVDVYKTKQQEAKDSREEASKKAFNQHIAEIIAEKEEADLRSKSIDELKAMMKP